MTRNQKDIVRRGYDKLSYAYRGDDTPDDHELYSEWIGELSTELAESASVLDIGCGCGLPATRLLAGRFAVKGVDISSIQIERAKKLVPSAEFICGDIMEMDFPAECFDAVVSFYAIIHMPLDEHLPLIERIVRWLRPGGIFMATVGHTAWTGEDDAYLGVEGGRMCWSHADEATYLRWMTEAGLDVQWSRFISEGDSGHSLVCAQKKPVAQADGELPEGNFAGARIHGVI